MITKLGGRKYTAFLFVCLLLFVLCLTNKITGNEFTAFITANLGIYVTGNVSQAIGIGGKQV